MRTKKNLDGEEGRNAEAGAANMAPTDPLEEGEQTLIRPDCHHHEDLEGSGDGFEPKKKKNLIRSRSKPRPIQEKNSYSKGLLDRRQRTVDGGKSNPLCPNRVKT